MQAHSNAPHAADGRRGMDSVSQKTYGKIDGTHGLEGSYAAARQSNLFANHDILTYGILFFKRFPQDSEGSRKVEKEKFCYKIC